MLLTIAGLRCPDLTT